MKYNVSFFRKFVAYLYLIYLFRNVDSGPKGKTRMQQVRYFDVVPGGTPAAKGDISLTRGKDISVQRKGYSR